MSPQLATMAQPNDQIQRARWERRADISSKFTWELSDVRRFNTDVVSVQTSERSILSSGGLERPGPNTLFFGAGGHDYVLLDIEVDELSRTNCRLAERPMMSYLLWNRLLVFPCSVQINM